MATLGQKPATTHVSFQKQTITGNGGTSYTLQQSVGSELDIAVFVNNTRQEPTTAYTASGTSLVMTGTVNSSDNFYVIFLAKAINTTGLPVSAVNTANINAGAVTNAKIANSTIDLTSKVTGILPAANSLTNAPAFEAKIPSTQAIADNTATLVLFQTEIIDTDDCYNNSLCRFTPNVAGKYFCYLRIGVNSNGSAQLQNAYIFLRKNGTNVGRSHFNHDGNNQRYSTMNISEIVDFNGSTDYIEAYVQTADTSGSADAYGYDYSRFGAFKLVGI